jgi:hypothetical protein
MALDHSIAVVWGLQEVAFADLGKVENATWSQLSLTKSGTFAINFEAPTITPIFAEEIVQAIANKVEQSGSQSIELDIPDLSPEVMSFFGATVTANSDGGKRVSVPEGAVTLNKMVRLKPTEGVKYIYFTNSTIVYNLSGGLTKSGEDTFNVHVTINVNAAKGGTTYEANGIIVDTFPVA